MCSDSVMDNCIVECVGEMPFYMRDICIYACFNWSVAIFRPALKMLSDERLSVLNDVVKTYHVH